MWSHTLPSIYGKGTRLRREAIQALDPKAVPVTIIAAENDKGTLFRVAPEGGRIHRDASIGLEGGALVLTSDELIEIAEE